MQKRRLSQGIENIHSEGFCERILSAKTIRRIQQNPFARYYKQYSIGEGKCQIELVGGDKDGLALLVCQLSQQSKHQDSMR